MTMPDRRIMPAQMTVSRWVAPDGWSHRRFDWPASGRAVRGSLLFQAGRADFVEKYLEPMAHWHDRGWNVAGFDWRGQGGSGRLLRDASIGHGESLDPLVDDLAAFLAEWRAATPPPHVIVAHSMGGHVVLRLFAERGVAVDAAVLAAPMLGINTAPLPDWLARAIAAVACRLGLAKRRAWKQSKSPASNAVAQSRLTHCADRFSDSLWWKTERPELGLGPPSWGWLSAAYASIGRLLARGRLETVGTPVLLLGAARDRLVRAQALHAAAARLPDARLVISDEAAHELLREIDDIRLPFLRLIDDFLDEKAPAR